MFMKEMEGRCIFVAILVVFLTEIHASLAENFGRASFPPGFVFGTASSAFQYEGAVKDGGRGPTVWDKYSHTFGRVLDFSNADVAVNQYHLYPEDTERMKDMGMDAYRFSIAWSRIFPNGTGEINQAGIDHYNSLIDTLLENGIEPYVTLYHWDLPQALEDRYNGWLDTQIINDYAMYVETCFQQFGNRVKYWITFNEPHTFAVQGYDVVLQAPGRCSILLHRFCRAGNSATEPYIVAHNVLLSHATVADIYSRKYKAKQRGSLAVSFDVIWFESVSNISEDVEAAQRAQDFQLRFLNPLMLGDYPSSMRSRVGNRLPTFTKAESIFLKGSLDFVGINHYTTFYAKPNSTNIIGNLLNDSIADIGAVTLLPEGIRKLLNYIKDTYGNPPVVITENGMDDKNNIFISLRKALEDDKRIKYHHDYLFNLLLSIRDGCNIKGYFVWSLLDNWEWGAGYTSRFGLYYVDYRDELRRYPKKSVQWFKNFLSSS